MKSDRPERAEAQGLRTTLKDRKYHLVERQIAIMLPHLFLLGTWGLQVFVAKLLLRPQSQRLQSHICSDTNFPFSFLIAVNLSEEE
jgi:hypothetical protein